MKLYKTAILIAIGFLLNIVPAQAAQFGIEKLKDSEDYAAVLASGDSIIGFANTLFRENGISEISAEDINWNDAYKVYIDEKDIFSDKQIEVTHITGQDLYIWCLPIENQDKIARLTLAVRNPIPQELVDKGVYTQEEMNAYNAEKAGTWAATEAILEDQVDAQTLENIEQKLRDAGISEKIPTYLLGGSPRFRSLFAVTFKNGCSDKVVIFDATQLSGTVKEGNALPLNNVGVQVYEFSQLSDLLEDPDTSEHMGGGSGGNLAQKNSISGNLVLLLGMVISLIAVVGIRKKRN